MESKENDYTGRGYGGVAVIARNSTKYSIKEITVASERIASIGLYDTNDKLIQVICSTYFPYYDGDKTRLAQYIETIDALQALIDTYASQAPIKLLGDFNTQLPKSAKLGKNWHKKKGFNTYSVLLYDFLTYNNYTSGDLLFNQKTKYTYFNHKRKIYTWIDHIIFHKNESRDVSACTVVQQETNNVSDHLPIRIIFHLALSPCADLPKVNKIDHLQPNWSNSKKNDLYLQITTKNISQLKALSVPTDKYFNLNEIIDNRFQDINNILKDATREAGCIPKKILAPRAYWCPELSALRDKKRIWWTIWVQSNRPREGLIFNINKDLKKKFRRLCRRKIKTISNKPVDTLNSYYKNKDMGAFWNKLRSSNHSKINSKLKSQDLADFYKYTMTDCSKLSGDQAKLSHDVRSKATNISCMCKTNKQAKLKYNSNDIIITAKCKKCGHPGSQVNFNKPIPGINKETITSIILNLKKSPTAGSDGITASHLFHALSEPLVEVLCDIYSASITTSTVPSIFKTGIIIPILKKSTLDPNTPSNYRPITISSVHSKIVEMTLIPDDTADETQFGFRKGRGTTTAVSLAHDMVKYMNNNNTPVYICSLDAEKCFDSIWHDGLFHKLNGKLPDHHWIFL